MNYDKFKEEVILALSSATGLDEKRIQELIETPPKEFGDVAFPCFSIAKKRKNPPEEIAERVKMEINRRLGYLIEKIEVKGAYVNFFANWEILGNCVMEEILKEGEEYGKTDTGKNKVMVIDFSAPNIAKPMTVGHLRSTIIGDSLYKILSFVGYKCIGDLHQGDWGTQFGRLIYAYKKWGKEEEFERYPTQHLFNVYIKFHEEVEKNKGIEEDARRCLKLLEERDRDIIALWKRFSKTSLEELDRIYKLLDVKFDLRLGESFYIERARRLINRLRKKGIAIESEGAIVVPLERYNLPPFIIQKSDEVTLYGTRDLATIEYREERFKPYRILYVVGSEQKLYFEQLFTVAGLIGYDKTKYIHIDFGMVNLPTGRMSTRKGRVIFLEELIERAIDIARDIIEEKNPKLEGKDEIAKQVGIGAIKYADLSQSRRKDIQFDWRKMLSFDGNSGPYIQYTYARARSILRKAGDRSCGFEFGELHEETETEIVRLLAKFRDAVATAAELYEPHHIANYLYTLADAFNRFYQKIPVLKAEEKKRDSRVALVRAVGTVLKTGLRLLGISAPERI